MRRPGTVGLSILLVGAWACGDQVVVARGVTLVSAAQSLSDAGADDAAVERQLPRDGGLHGGKIEHHLPPLPPRLKPRH